MTDDNLPESLDEFSRGIHWNAATRIEVTRPVWRRLWDLYVASASPYIPVCGNALVFGHKTIYCEQPATLEDRVAALEAQMRTR